MKKTLLLTIFCLFAVLGYGQITFTDQGDAIAVSDGHNALQFSKSGLLIQRVNQNIVFVAGGGVYRYPFADIDIPSYSTVDDVYSEISGWLAGTFVFNGGITSDSATINWLIGDTAIFDYIEGDTNLVNKLIWPDANDGAPIGTATVSFSDLFLAEGGVINWDNGDATLTQVGNVVTLAGADLKVSSPGTAATSIATIDGTQELTNKTINAGVGKGTWTASGTWTLPALTLGGTVSGGGNQMNNVIIGTTTPLAGTFTTITGTSFTDGTASWSATQDLTGFDTVSAYTINADTFGISSTDQQTFKGRLASNYFQSISDISGLARQHIISGTAKLTGDDPFNGKTQMQGGFFSIQMDEGTTITQERDVYGAEVKATIDRSFSDASSDAIGLLAKACARKTGTYAGNMYAVYSQLDAVNTPTVAQGYNYFANITNGTYFTNKTIFGVGAATWDYLIDADAGTFTTADIRLQNGETIDNTTNGVITVTGDLVATKKVKAADSLCLQRFRWASKGIAPLDTLVLIRGTDTIEWHPARTP